MSKVSSPFTRAVHDISDVDQMIKPSCAPESSLILCILDLMNEIITIRSNRMQF